MHLPSRLEDEQKFCTIFVYYFLPVPLLDEIVLSFSQQIVAFGISFQPLSIETCIITIGSGESTLPFGTLEEWSFAGIISDTPFSEVSLMTIPNGFCYVFDNMVYASKVPVPGALWLFGSGLISLVCLRKKIHKTSL